DSTLPRNIIRQKCDPFNVCWQIHIKSFDSLTAFDRAGGEKAKRVEQKRTPRIIPIMSSVWPTMNGPAAQYFTYRTRPAIKNEMSLAHVSGHRRPSCRSELRRCLHRTWALGRAALRHNLSSNL